MSFCEDTKSTFCVTWIETVPQSEDIVWSKHNPKSDCVTQNAQASGWDECIVIIDKKKFESVFAFCECYWTTFTLVLLYFALVGELFSLHPSLNTGVYINVLCTNIVYESLLDESESTFIHFLHLKPSCACVKNVLEVST